MSPALSRMVWRSDARSCEMESKRFWNWKIIYFHRIAALHGTQTSDWCAVSSWGDEHEKSIWRWLPRLASFCDGIFHLMKLKHSVETLMRVADINGLADGLMDAKKKHRRQRRIVERLITSVRRQPINARCEEMTFSSDTTNKPKTSQIGRMSVPASVCAIQNMKFETFDKYLPANGLLARRRKQTKKISSIPSHPQAHTENWDIRQEWTTMFAKYKYLVPSMTCSFLSVRTYLHNVDMYVSMYNMYVVCA